VGHPDLASDRQALARMEARLAAQEEK